MENEFKALKTAVANPPVLGFSNFDKPYVVETDASSIDIGAVLSQKQSGGKVHPIQYASRTMTHAERNYSACEREAPAVVFALSKFQVCMLSTEPLCFSTDHQALKAAFLKKDIHGRLAR